LAAREVKRAEVQLITFRLPSGSTEQHIVLHAPKIGDLVNRNGDAWVVEEVSTTDEGATVVSMRPNLSLLAGGRLNGT
jgi:hypothetical protein